MSPASQLLASRRANRILAIHDPSDAPATRASASADVAYRRKSAVQCVAQHFCRVARDIGQGLGLKIRDLDTRSQNMTVRIDQSRHQCLSADIDDIAVDGG